MYELAPLTRRLDEAETDAAMHLYTPEARPLSLCGPDVGATLSDLLGRQRVAVRRAYPKLYEEGRLLLLLEREIAADAVVALPGRRGPALPGLPSDELGFLPVDETCAVVDLERVSDGDEVTHFPVRPSPFLAASGAPPVAPGTGMAVR